MSQPMRLKTYDPKERQERRLHEANGDCEFILRCFSCHKDFSVWIGYGNMGQCWFDCPHCKETNEIE